MEALVLNTIAALTVLIIFAGVIFFGYWYLSKNKPQNKQDDTPKEVKVVNKEIDTLSTVLASLNDAKRENANIKISDAQTVARLVLKSATVFAKRVEDYQNRADLLNEALKALQAEDRKVLAVLSGRISTFDGDISQVLLSDVSFKNDKYWLSIVSLVASQLGVYSQWGTIYQEYSASLVNKVTIEKSRIVMLTSAGEFIEASRPLLEIQKHLEEAQTLLRLNSPLVRNRLPKVRLLT